MKTIKSKNVVAYMELCNDMSNYLGNNYEIGKCYSISGRVSSDNSYPAQLNYVRAINECRLSKNRLFKVSLSGTITCYNNETTQVYASQMTLLEEIDIINPIKNVKWWKNEGVLDLLDFEEDYANIVIKFGLCNFVDKTGKLLFDYHLPYWQINNFSNGFARIQREDLSCNFIDKKGKLLSDEWFKDANDFSEGFAAVQRKEDYLCNFIDVKGNYLSDEWFEDVWSFDTGIAPVKRVNGEWWQIDKTGKLYDK